jgi:colanic acid/amylovoran biosynthesis glycosyltransferase
MYRSSNNREAFSTHVAYVVGRYPAVSHAFVTREVLALRKAGVRVDTISIHTAPAEDVLSEVDRSERDTTYSLLPIRIGAFVSAHLRAFLKSPRAYLATMAQALLNSPGGVRGRLWQLFYFAEGILVWRHCTRTGARHIHAHHLNQASDAAMLAAHYGNAVGSDPPWTWSFTMHGPNEFYDVSRFRLAHKARDAAMVVCISDFARSQVMGFTPEEAWPRLRAVHCGVDPTEYDPDREEAARTAGIFRILYVGRLVAFKGQGVLLDALASLRDTGVDARLDLVGDGPSRAYLQQRAEALGLAEEVTFLGAVGQDEIRAHYSAADVFCLPSFAEGVPVVLMEAMAMRVPVVTTRIMGISELIDDEVDGLLVRPGRVDQLTRALARLANDPELREELGRRGREKVLAEFDVRESGRRLGELFTDATTAIPGDQQPIGNGQLWQKFRPLNL